MIDIYKMIIEDKLPNIQTAQTVNAESIGESRAQDYFTMLGEYKLGYMAGLKNLKNILDSLSTFDAENKRLMVDRLVGLLTNEKLNRKSMVLPFRFVGAYNIVSDMSMDRFLQKDLLDAIETGFILSAKNISIVDEDETVAILLDDSYSMHGEPYKHGISLMASMLAGLEKAKVVGYLWSDNAREVSVTDSPFGFIKNNQPRGGGTDISAPLKDLIATNTKVDKVVILTDMQMYGGYGDLGGTLTKYIKKYRKISPNVKVLFWNLQGYGGSTPAKLSHDILEVSGYSDKLLSIIPKMWKNENALIDEIQAIEL